MPPALIDDDEEYASGEDSDFAPDAAPAQASDVTESESEAEDEAAKEKLKSKRKRGADEEAEDAGFENSGDEAIIERGLKRQKRKDKKGKEELEDKGGEDGLIKTRSMRAQEKVEKKPLADTTAATVDVDALWKQMISGAPAPAPLTEPAPTPAPEDLSASATQLPPSKTTPQSPNSKEPQSPSTQRSARESSNFNDGPSSMMMIKRTYKFAGKTHAEEKLVPRNSAEARLFLASQSQSEAKPTQHPPTDPSAKPKRPLKKARRSIFEPVFDIPIRTNLKFGVRARSNGAPVKKWAAVGQEDKGKKLNTVEKSALDWAGYVDKEGIAEELDAASKAKGAYGERQQFLARVKQKKEEEARRARGVV